jgi:hypothetical protein
MRATISPSIDAQFVHCSSIGHAFNLDGAALGVYWAREGEKERTVAILQVDLGGGERRLASPQMDEGPET